MIDNLTEAISHAKEVVEDKREEVAYWNKVKGVGVFTDENTEHLLTKCEECASEHEQLAEWLTELQERREADRWIPVCERLPNTLGVYNVTRKIIEGETSYVISDACYFDGQNTWHADTGVNHGRPYLTDVIAWQPLPEPYKKGGTE